MKLNYIITEDEYVELIEYQMNLKKNSLSQKLKFWISNIIFITMALYFLFVREQYSWIVRILPMIMAIILFAMAIYRRTHIHARAKKALERYKRSGLLDKEYIGKHTLIVENGIIKRKYGSKLSDISYEEIYIEKLKISTLLIGRGVVFEIIPNRILEANENRIRFEEELKNKNNKDIKNPQENIKKTISNDVKIKITWNIDWNVYIKGQVQGYRRFYSTKNAWNGSQFIRILILLYGITVSQMNLYIGLSFIIIGLIINRQMLITFSPLIYNIVRQQIGKIIGKTGEHEEGNIYITDDELIIELYDQIQRMYLNDGYIIKSNSEFIFIYTKNTQMFVIPLKAFSSDSELKQLYSLL